MAYNTTVYSVKHSRRTGKWSIYVDGRPVVKDKKPRAGGEKRTYHEYSKKKTAVKKARDMAKRDANRDYISGSSKVQLKVWNKSGMDTTEVSNYD